MPDVEITGPGGVTTQAYARTPDGASRGMVVIHELLGMQPEIRRVVDRLQDAGFAAVAPDLGFSPRHPVCLVRAFRAALTGKGPFFDRIDDARRWLGETSGVAADRVGIIGFCLGGSFALAAGPGWGAVSVNYGDVPPTDVLRGIGPVIGCYGGRDRVFRKKATVLDERLDELGVPHEVEVYPTVGHAFLTDGHHPVMRAVTYVSGLRVSYDAAVAEQAWAKILGFLDTHLPSSA